MNMRKVAIVGAGQSKYGEFPEKGIKELFFDAYKDMTASIDKGLDPRAIDAAYIGNLGSGGFQLGNMSALVAEYCGLPTATPSGWRTPAGPADTRWSRRSWMSCLGTASLPSPAEWRR
jgi:hypothetical protein